MRGQLPQVSRVIQEGDVLLERNRSEENTLSGVVEWMEREQYITFPLMAAIANTEKAVRHMIKRKERIIK